MNSLLIVLAVVVVIGVVVALALNPVLNKKGDAAILRCKEALGADAITTIEPKANGFGTEPASAGGLRGMGCLALSGTDLMFVTWAPQKELRIARSAITKVETSADDVAGPQKAMMMVTFTSDDGSSATASWRLPELVEWLTALGYDFGPDGPPAPVGDEPDEVDD
jgi:hypothetical protein